MIQIETYTANGKKFVRTYSDNGCMIERDGVLYSEALDLAEFNRQYTETNVSIDRGLEATEEDYLAALEQLGVYAYA